MCGLHYRSSAESAKALRAELGDGFLLQADLADIDQVEAMVSANPGADRSCRRSRQQRRGLHQRRHAADADRTVRRSAGAPAGHLVSHETDPPPVHAPEGSGRIINISSVVGHTGNGGQIPYTMEKAALDAFTKSLAAELAGRNILVNSVAPGFIETEMTSALPEEIRERILSGIPLGRMGDPRRWRKWWVSWPRRAHTSPGSVIHVNGGSYGG